MTRLEDLVGQPLHEISDEDLEQAIMKGRLAREVEAKEKSPKAKTSVSPRVATVNIEIDLDDFV